MKVDIRTQLDVFLETEIEDNKERIIDNENVDLGDIDSIYSIFIYLYIYIPNYIQLIYLMLVNVKELQMSLSIS